MTVCFASPGLQVRKVSSAFFIQHDDFTIEYRLYLPCFKCIKNGIEFLVERFVITGTYVDFPVIQVRKGPVTIPFHFINPAFFLNRFVNKRGEHRLYVRWKYRLP